MKFEWPVLKHEIREMLNSILDLLQQKVLIKSGAFKTRVLSKE